MARGRSLEEVVDVLSNLPPLPLGGPLTPRSPKVDAPHRAELYTDASRTGWGCVVVTDDEVHVSEARCDHSIAGLSINVMEAVVNAFKRFNFLLLFLMCLCFLLFPSKQRERGKASAACQHQQT